MKDEYLNHKDFIESLKNPSLDIYHKVYHKNKKEPIHHPGDKTVKKKTLSQRMEQLEVTVKELVTTVTTLAKTVSNGFKRIDSRIDNLEKDINTRLDYIVKENNLKDSK